MTPIPTVVLGAAGRDFHVFNTIYRDDPAFRVVAFTAAQIPGIAGRRYPAALAGCAGSKLSWLANLRKRPSIGTPICE